MLRLDLYTYAYIGLMEEYKKEKALPHIDEADQERVRELGRKIEEVKRVIDEEKEMYKREKEKYGGKRKDVLVVE